MVKIPILPLSAVTFYLILMLLWNLGVVPAPKELIGILERLFQQFGYFGLVLATLLEGTAYICLYVPGALVIALTVLFSDKSAVSLSIISIIVALSLTITSFINYYLGRFLAHRKGWVKEEPPEKTSRFSKKLWFAIMHPNFLAFYFLNSGLKKRNFKQIFYVPILMIPYGLLVAFLLATYSKPIRQGLEDTTFSLIVLLIWLIVTTWAENKKWFYRRFKLIQK